MRSAFLIAVAALALAGCQSAAEKQAAETGEINVQNMPLSEVAKLIEAAAPKNAVKPGMWKAELRIDGVDVGQGDGGAQLAAAKALERNTTECRTAEQLKPFDISKLEQAAGECAFIRYVSGRGKVDALIQCSKPGVPVTTISLKGTTSPTGFNVMTENNTGTAAQPGYSVIKMRSSGTRLGDCSA